MDHALTTKQLRMLLESIGDGKNPPKFTEDPRVNHAVDCVIMYGGEEPEYDEQERIIEIETAKAEGLM